MSPNDQSGTSNLERETSNAQTSNSNSPHSSQKPSPPIHHDVILAMRDPYIHQITTGQKSHEFRKCLLPRTIQRIWFYCTAPHSGIEYICAIAPAQTRGGPNDVLPEESGLGNKEFNEYHEEWTGYDYAFKILSVHQLAEPLPLSELKGRFGTKAAPQGMVYTPRTILEGVDWRKNAVKIL